MDLTIDVDKLTDPNPLNKNILVELTNVFRRRCFFDPVLVCFLIPSAKGSAFVYLSMRRPTFQEWT